MGETSSMFVKCLEAKGRAKVKPSKVYTLIVEILKLEFQACPPWGLLCCILFPHVVPILLWSFYASISFGRSILSHLIGSCMLYLIYPIHLSLASCVLFFISSIHTFSFITSFPIHSILFDHTSTKSFSSLQLPVPPIFELESS